MARPKRRRNNIGAPTPELPADLLLEIVARTDFFTLVHCAAVSKQLRRHILSTSFIRRITQQGAPCILALLCTYSKKPLTLMHPTTAAAASFCHEYLSPFMSHNAGKDVLDPYCPVVSCGGLAVLDLKHRSKSKGYFDPCVYEPMTGHRTFLPKPPAIQICLCNVHKYVILTVADGIDCSFMLLSITFNISNMKVHAATSSSGTWGPVTSRRHPDSMPWSICPNNDPAVFRGGLIHWLRSTGDQIVTYDVRTRKPGRMKLPVSNRNASQLHLATSPDGNLLKLLAIDVFTISVWLRLATAPTRGGNDGWALESVINIEEKLRLFYPNIPIEDDPNVLVRFEGSGKRSDDVVLLEVEYKQGCIVLDLKTKEMHWKKWGSSYGLLEFDLPSQLQAMKVFS